MGMLNTRVWSLQSVDTSFKNKTEDLEMGRNKAIELKPSFVDGVAGDGAVYSSVADMVIWDGFWHANPLISPENLQEAFLTPVLKNGKTAEYGFGWMITPFGMWHNGSWLGARTFIVRNTKLKTCMVILDNSSNVFFDKIIAALSESDR
jgi:CubicO group peptidase (beta-lactamase class C family)